MDREAIIIKTMRDLLLRVDSMDLRIGQFGENLKTLNNLLPVSTSIRRDSNFSTRLQQFATSGTMIRHDPTEFYNSIDRLNFDLSLHSNTANNTIADVEDDLDVTLNSDDVEDNRDVNLSQHRQKAPLPASETIAVATNECSGPAIATISPTATSSASVCTITTANPITTAVPVTSSIPAAATVVATTANAATPCNLSYATVASKPAVTTSAPQRAVRMGSNSSSTTQRLPNTSSQKHTSSLSTTTTGSTSALGVNPIAAPQTANSSSCSG
nr:uncharacterized protein LOC115259242 [Aedes albopictus]